MAGIVEKTRTKTRLAQVFTKKFLRDFGPLTTKTYFYRPFGQKGSYIFLSFFIAWALGTNGTLRDQKQHAACRQMILSLLLLPLEALALGSHPNLSSLFVDPGARPFGSGFIFCFAI